MQGRVNEACEGAVDERFPQRLARGTRTFCSLRHLPIMYARRSALISVISFAHSDSRVPAGAGLIEALSVASTAQVDQQSNLIRA